jgi:hypothetical protein
MLEFLIKKNNAKPFKSFAVLKRVEWFCERGGQQGVETTNISNKN